MAVDEDNMSDREKAFIDGASYETLLRKWRFEPTHSSYFTGQRGSYFAEIMNEKKELCDHVDASKNIGWG